MSLRSLGNTESSTGEDCVRGTKTPSEEQSRPEGSTRRGSQLTDPALTVSTDMEEEYHDANARSRITSNYLPVESYIARADKLTEQLARLIDEDGWETDPCMCPLSSSRIRHVFSAYTFVSQGCTIAKFKRFGLAISGTEQEGSRLKKGHTSCGFSNQNQRKELVLCSIAITLHRI